MKRPQAAVRIALAERLRHQRIGQVEHAAVLQPERGDVHRIAAAVLGNFARP